MNSSPATAPVRAARQKPAAAAETASAPAATPTPAMQRQGLLAVLPKLPTAKKTATLSPPAERALASLAAVQAFVIKPGAEVSFLEPSEAKGARTAVFPLEALLRSFVERFGAPFDKHLLRVKALEDAIGHHIDAVDRCADMRKLGQPDLVNYWARRQTQQRELLTDVLTKRWVPHTAGNKAEVPRLAKDLRDAKWGDATTDRNANIEGLVREANRVVTKKLDMSDADQVHVLRRACRWYALLARGLSGAVVLVDDGAPEKFNHYLTSPAAKLEFASLPPAPKEPNPITLSKALWIGGSYVIEELGNLKAKGELLLAVAEALVHERGVKPEKAQAEALKIMGVSKAERQAWTDAAEALQTEAKAIFAAIADQMTAQVTPRATK